MEQPGSAGRTCSAPASCVRYAGGYYSRFIPSDSDISTGSPSRVAYRIRHVHVAVGYPSVEFLPDLQNYRETHRDVSRVVNAYEPHDHVYAELQRRPSTVVVRGSGIVASRILQRLFDDGATYALDRSYCVGREPVIAADRDLTPLVRKVFAYETVARSV